MGENRINGHRISESAGWPFGVSTDAFYAGLPTMQPASTADIYAVAWTLAQRDHEISKLFNAPFYYEI